MATTSYAKADSVATRIVNTYSQSEGFRGASVKSDRNLGTYHIVVVLETYSKIKVPKKLDQVDIQVQRVSERKQPRK